MKKKKNKNKAKAIVAENVEVVEAEVVEDKIIAEARTFTDEQIAKFQEECGKRPTFTIADFKNTILKPCEELTYKDVRIIINKVGWLSDDEKKKFRSILFEENLTKEELEKYTNLYGNGHQFKKYFHKKDDNE